MHLRPPSGGFVCVSFEDGCSVVVDSLLIIDLIACPVCVWSLFCYEILSIL